MQGYEISMIPSTKLWVTDIDKSKDPAFAPDIPPSPTLPPFDPDKNPPNWFKLAWNTLSPALALVAEKWPKFAEFYAPFKAAGDKLVEVLTKYFKPGSEGDTITYRELEPAMKDVNRLQYPDLRANKLGYWYMIKNEWNVEKCATLYHSTKSNKNNNFESLTDN